MVKLNNLLSQFLHHHNHIHSRQTTSFLTLKTQFNVLQDEEKRAEFKVRRKSSAQILSTLSRKENERWKRRRKVNEPFSRSRALDLQSEISITLAAARVSVGLKKMLRSLQV